MRIGVDASCWVNPRGYGRFTREILAALARRASGDELVAIVDEASAPRVDFAGPNVRVRAVRTGAPAAASASADGSRSPRDMLRMTSAVRDERLDVFFSPSVYTWFPLPRRLAAVVTVHDAIAERFPKLTLPGFRARLFWKIKVALALRHAKLVLTVSDFAARELREVLRIPAERIRVAVEAPSPAWRPAPPEAVDDARRRHGIPDGTPWFLYVGGFNPHKNVDVLARAHAALARGAARPPVLVLAGPIGEDNFHGDLGRIRAAIAACGTAEHVRWTGFLPDAELAALHTGARALVLPSECEGFGLPAVEAAACGAPVIATTRSPLPELLAGGGLFVAPRDEAALVAAMRALLDDEPRRAALGAEARRRAGELSWERAADRVYDALAEAAR